MSAAPAHPNLPAVIAMRGVAVSSQRDPDRIVADGVEWQVGPGELWVVGGPQRSGKSDLLMLTGGLTSPARGEYAFLGEAMPIFEEERMPERLKIGLVFDSGQLFNRMTVAENIALPLRYHRNLNRAAAEAEVQEVIALLELEPYARQFPARLSRNWQKRAGLARALILKPELLLVDNPLGGLDGRHSNWWLGFLEQLCAGHSYLAKRRATVVVTTDDLARLAAGLRGPAHFALMTEGGFLVIGGREALAACADERVRDLMSPPAPA